MKFYTSYFYQIRFFTPNMIPISTAKWDPKWYSHSGEPYVDKRGVINGLRAPIMTLPEGYLDKIECSKPCKYSAPDCNFMLAYYDYLNTLDFQDFYNRCIDLAMRAAVITMKDPPDENVSVVLMVHEPKTCDCAERPVIQQWFKENGVNITEWEK